MQKILDVLFFSQLDNIFNPYGSCNVTAIAMCLSYLGIVGDNSQKQLEDQLYHLCLYNRLSRHDPLDLVKLVKLKGKKDQFRFDAKIKDVINSINAGKPTVLHGYFTRSGHIIVCHGYSGSNLICHDPYGNYMDNYSTDAINGKNVEYPIRLIEDVCMPDGNLWLHSICN